MLKRGCVFWCNLGEEKKIEVEIEVEQEVGYKPAQQKTRSFLRHDHAKGWQYRYKKENNIARLLTFSKHERLKSRKTIELLFKTGQSFAIHPIRVYFLALSNQPQTNPAQREGYPPLIGVTASSRNFKKATDRNRIKRLLRESYRLQKKLLLQQLPPDTQYALFFMYTGKKLPDYAALYQTMSAVLQKLGQQVRHQKSGT